MGSAKIVSWDARHIDHSIEKDLAPLELVAFNLWRPFHVQSVGGKTYMMVIIDGGTSYKYGIYLPDKSDKATIEAFDVFHIRAETATKRKIRQMQTDCAYNSAAWEEYCKIHGIIHEFTTPYSSVQNGLAECAIRTIIDDVCTLLHDSGLGHSYWAEAAAYSINMQNLIPSCQHPNNIPTETFLGKRQNVAYLRVFGSKCWAKIPTAQGGSKLHP
jgi:transposase InsO family protein